MGGQREHVHEGIEFMHVIPIVETDEPLADGRVFPWVHDFPGPFLSFGLCADRQHLHVGKLLQQPGQGLAEFEVSLLQYETANDSNDEGIRIETYGNSPSPSLVGSPVRG